MTELAKRFDLQPSAESVFSKVWSAAKLRLRRQIGLGGRVDSAVPDLLLALSACIRGGASFVDAIGWIRERSSSPLREELDAMLAHFRVGGTVTESLISYERESANQDLKELALKLALADQLGSPVAKALDAMVDSSSAALDASLLALGAKKENQLLYPLVFLVLPVTVLFVVYPSLQFFQFESM